MKLILIFLNNRTSVRLGEHDLSKDPDPEDLAGQPYYADPAVNVQIERVIVHPLYDTETLAHDIALLKLAKDITFSGKCNKFDYDYEYT